MRAVEMILGGAIVVVLVLGVAAVLTNGTGPPGDGDDDVVGQTEPEGRDSGGQPDDGDVVEQPDESDAESTPGSEGTTPEPPENGAQPGEGQPPEDGAEPGEEGPPGADAAPGPQADHAPEPAQPPDPASPGSAQDQTGSQPDGEDSRIALDEPSAEHPGVAEPSRTLPNTGGAVPAVIGLGLLAASGLVGLLRLRMNR